ncbi:MAG: hypothetical protein AAGM22_14505 [Acidobacteriota bacterium]
MRTVGVLAVAWLGLLGVVGWAPAHADVQVNTFTTSSQYSPAVATDADGDFIVVWASLGSDGTDSDGFSIQGQRFSADGSPAGAQFQVNAYTSGSQRSPEVSIDADGDAVVVWESDISPGGDSSNSSIQGQRYASDGSPVASQFQVNTYTSGPQQSPAVAVDADRDFVVTWTSQNAGGSDSSSYSIQGQRYASDGSAIAAEFQVNTYTSGEQTSSSVGMDSDGDFVVAWRSATSTGADTSADSVQARRFASDGSAVAGQFEVNGFTTGVQTSPSVAVDADGDFVIAWMSAGSAGTDSDAYSVQGQRYASDGTAAGSQFQANTYTTSLQFDPSVAMDAGGGFVITWNSSGSAGTDTSGPSIQLQRYASDGSTVAAEFQVNNVTSGFQDSPQIAVDADGDFVVVWTSSSSSGTDSSGYSVQKTDPGFVPVELVSFRVD